MGTVSNIFTEGTRAYGEQVSENFEECFVYQGAYDAGTTYAANDGVSYSGTKWLSLQDSNVGNTPSEGAYWTSLGGSTALDINGLTAETSLSDSDTIPVYDASATANRKFTAANVFAGLLATARNYLAGYVDLVEGSAPSNPSAGRGRFYLKTGGILAWRNSAGTETEIGSGAGGDMLKATYDANNDGNVDVGGGGTGADNAADARSNLGVAIGVDVQAYDAELAALASVTSAANKVPYFTGSGTASVADLTAAGRALIDDASAAAQRTTLELGTSATLDVPAAGNAASGEVVKGSDTRLTDTRIPTDNTVSTVKIQDDAVTYAKMQNVSATDKLLGRSTSGAGNVEEITCTSFARTILDDTDAATVRTTIGAAASMPAPVAVAESTGTWSPNLANGDHFEMVTSGAGGASMDTPSGTPIDGKVYIFEFYVAGAGDTVSLPASFIFPDGDTTDFSPGAGKLLKVIAQYKNTSFGPSTTLGAAHYAAVAEIRTAP